MRVSKWCEKETNRYVRLVITHKSTIVYIAVPRELEAELLAA
jgi:hypothetical protein